MTKPTNELHIHAVIPTTADAMDQAALINCGSEAIAALRAFVEANGGTLTVKSVRKMEGKPRPTGAPHVVSGPRAAAE